MFKRAALMNSALMNSTALPMVFREAVNPLLAGIPALGIVGTEAIREAFDGDLNQLRDLLQSEVKRVLELSGEDDWWPYIHALFDDRIVVEHKDGKLHAYPYTVDGTDVSLSSPTEVVKQYIPVSDATAGSMREASGAFLEADATTGGVFRIRVIRAGLSGNRTLYTNTVLREAVPLFDGVRVFVKSDAEHLAGGGKDVRNLIGALSNVAFVEGSKPETGEIQADFTLIQPDGDVAVQLREAWDRSLAGLFGFSINARGTGKRRKSGAMIIREATKITAVKSVDLIVEAGAGGEIINLIEAKGGDVMGREEIIIMLEAAGMVRADLENLDDAALQSKLDATFREAVARPNPPTPEAGAGTPGDHGGDDGDNAPVTIADLRMVEARGRAHTAIGASALPQPAQARLIERFTEATGFADADVTAAIEAEANYLRDAGFGGGQVSGLGEGHGRVRLIESRFEKTESMLDAFFDPAHADHRHAQSFRECYINITGDTHLTGRVRDCDQALFREALDTATLSEVLGDSIHRRMIADYRLPTPYDVYRRLFTTPTPITDFRVNHRTRFGGYGDLPAVAKDAAYQALTSPTDEEATYQISKHGGLESINLETIANDDVGLVRQIPTKLSRAAKRTLSKFALDFMATNPVIYDGVALYHASHGNLGTAALDGAAVAARRLAMLQQTEKDSGDRLGIPARDLFVPSDLEETAVDLFRRNTENDRTFQQSLALEVIPVWYWTDPSDWFMNANPADVPFLELGFFNGNEEPELFVQDSPTVGSMFTNDQLTWKIRHIYGAAVIEYRGTQGSIVL